MHDGPFARERMLRLGDAPTPAAPDTNGLLATILRVLEEIRDDQRELLRRTPDVQHLPAWRPPMVFRTKLSVDAWAAGLLAAVFSPEVREQTSDLTQQIDALRAEVMRMPGMGDATQADRERLARQSIADRARSDALAKGWPEGSLQ